MQVQVLIVCPGLKPWAVAECGEREGIEVTHPVHGMCTGERHTRKAIHAIFGFWPVF